MVKQVALWLPLQLLRTIWAKDPTYWDYDCRWKVHPKKDSSPRCDEGWNNCCTGKECGWGEGDCDYDSQCKGDLVCGTNNCLDMWGDCSQVHLGKWNDWNWGDDCCTVRDVKEARTKYCDLFQYDCLGVQSPNQQAEPYCDHGDNGCCRYNRQCYWGEGDCDIDDHCRGTVNFPYEVILCNSDNCKDLWEDESMEHIGNINDWSDTDDCCAYGYCFLREMRVKYCKAVNNDGKRIPVKNATADALRLKIIEYLDKQWKNATGKKWIPEYARLKGGRANLIEGSEDEEKDGNAEEGEKRDSDEKNKVGVEDQDNDKEVDVDVELGKGVKRFLTRGSRKASRKDGKKDSKKVDDKNDDEDEEEDAEKRKMHGKEEKDGIRAKIMEEVSGKGKVISRKNTFKVDVDFDSRNGKKKPRAMKPEDKD